jgi:pSer/pThr/pTyr-binding forkhead associated (FHA) protein
MQQRDHVCEQCGTTNTQYALVCTNCGKFLVDARESTAVIRTDPLSLRKRRTDSQITERPVLQSVLVLHIRGSVERLMFEEGSTLTLGRADLNSPNPQVFDLTRFGAHDRGVSRAHAMLRFTEAQLVISDLASVNGTFLNARRLTPHEIYTLNENDDLMLGRLPIKVHFEAPNDTDQVRTLRVGQTGPLPPAKTGPLPTTGMLSKRD